MDEYKGFFFDNPNEIHYFEGGAHFKYNDLVAALNELIKTLPRSRHGRSESGNVRRSNVLNFNIGNVAYNNTEGNEELNNKSRNIKPLIQSLTMKLNEITKEKKTNDGTENNQIEGRRNRNNSNNIIDVRQRSNNKKEILIQDNNVNLLSKDLLYNKLYNKHRNNVSTNKNLSSSINKSNNSNKKSLDMSHSKYTRNKQMIMSDMIKAANNTKNDSFNMNKSKNSLINRINISSIMRTQLNTTQNVHHHTSSTINNINKAKMTNIKKTILTIPHNTNKRPIKTAKPTVSTKKRNKSINFYCNTETNNGHTVTNELSLLSELNASLSKEKMISINHITTTNNNNNIIVRPKINISFVNNITKSPSHSLSKKKSSDNNKSRNKGVEYGGSIMKLNTTVKQKLLNEIFQTSQIKKSPVKKNNASKGKINMMDRYSTLQKKIADMKIKSKTTAINNMMKKKTSSSNKNRSISKGTVTKKK